MRFFALSKVLGRRINHVYCVQVYKMRHKYQKCIRSPLDGEANAVVHPQFLHTT